MQTLKLFLFLIFILTIASCANSYKWVDIENQREGNQTSSNGVTLTYKYDVLKKRYHKKEYSKKIRVVQVEINNQSGQDLVFGKDLKITEADGTERYLLSTEAIFTSLKQHPAVYLIYLALTPVKLTVNNGVQQTVTPVGYVLGPLLALGNMIFAASANEKFRFQLERSNLHNRTIRDGETVYGLIGIDAVGSKSLGIKIVYP